MGSLFLKREPLILPQFVILLLDLSFVRQLQRLNFLPFLLARLLSIVLAHTQVLRKHEIADFIILRLFQSLLLSFLHILRILLHLLLGHSDVVERHDLPMLKLAEFHAESYLVSTHVTHRKLLSLSLVKTLLNHTFIPHACGRINSQTNGLLMKEALIDGLQQGDLLLGQRLLASVADPSHLDRVVGYLLNERRVPSFIIGEVRLTHSINRVRTQLLLRINQKFVLICMHLHLQLQAIPHLLKLLKRVLLGSGCRFVVL